MMVRLPVFIGLIAAASAASFDCAKHFPGSNLSPNYNETIAHAIHSMTMEGLRMFNPKATERNFVPTVNQDLSTENHVTDHAPYDTPGAEFETMTMNIVDKILSSLGNSKDGLGPNWSAVERVVHVFHMWDLWYKIKENAWKDVQTNPPSDKLCSCLVSVEYNGIKNAVGWVADHYKTGTPITLMNRPIPKLVDAKSWGTWKARLLHYYNDDALRDAAMYLYCIQQFW